MKRAVHQFVLVAAALGALGASVSPAWAGPAASASAPFTVGSVGGTVINSVGLPQSGIIVELLYADSTLAARAMTDTRGSYRFAAVITGQYSLKAIGANYIPTLKQNLRVRANTIVNLTLNSLYDVMQWTPRPKRVRPQGQDDDWSWTLRTSESRPLLRWQEDGSPVLVSDGSAETRSAAQRQLRARVKAVAGKRSFGESETDVSAAAVTQRSERYRLAMNAEVAPDTSGVMDAMLGFRQEMTAGGLGSGSIQNVAAVMNDPRAQIGSAQGLQVAAFRTWESLQILDNLEAEAGSEQVAARAGQGGTILAALPFARVTMHRGESALEYSVASSRPAASGDTVDQLSPAAWLPMISTHNGSLAIEHGLHQELGFATTAGPAEMRLVIYGDSIENPVLEGAGRLSSSGPASQWLLVDGASGLVRAAGPHYSTTGMLASVESQLPGHNHIKLSYASGDALVLHSTLLRPADLSTILAGVHAHRAQMYALSLSGTAETTGTRWRASYRWQPGDTVTAVAPFAVDASEPYLNIYVRQPLHLASAGANREAPSPIEIQIDLRNLLAEGYQPFITSDGSQLIFAQAQRSLSGGVAFNF